MDGREVRTHVAEREVVLGSFDFVYTLRILVNVLENAHKYAPPGTPLEITAKREGAELNISIFDRGPGIPVAERERIFHPFYRPADAPPDAASAGLGLAIARRLAEAQGGALSFAPRPGGGSTFMLTLPAADFRPIEPS